MRKADGTWRRILWLLLVASSVLLLVLVGLDSYLPDPVDRYTAHAPAVQVTLLPPMASNWLPNAGDAALLDMLPGIGTALAARIIENREQDGAFFFPEDLMAVKGIGEKTVEGIKQWLLAHPEYAYVPQEEGNR